MDNPRLLSRIAELEGEFFDLPPGSALRTRIVHIGTELREIYPHLLARITELEAELDEAIFDLYELNEADRDLVRDMCGYGLDFFYNRSESIAVKPLALPEVTHGLFSSLPTQRADGLDGYLQVFLSQWNADLAQEGELAWEVIAAPGKSPVIAALFSVVSNGERVESAKGTNSGAWNCLLKRIENSSLIPAEFYHTLYTDTFIRVVSEHEILIIKRNEARHWTRSMARADADATIAQAMNLADRNA